MPRVKVGKVGVYVYISERVWEDFKMFVLMKYKKLHGTLSSEVERALEEYLKSRSHAKNTRTNLYRVWEDVKNYLSRKYKYVIVPGETTILKSHLIEAIKLTRGVDKRTVEKWLRAFTWFKIIKPLNEKVYEVLG